MDEVAEKWLIFGGATAALLLVVLVTLLCFCRRRRRRRVHMEKITIESPNPSYKTNLAGITPTIGSGRNNKTSDYNNSYDSASPQHIQTGFSQVFRGSPTMPRKTFEAPPPLTSNSPYSYDAKAHSPYGGSAIGENGSLRSIIVIDNDEKNNKKSLHSPSTTKSTTTTMTISPKSAGERLSLKNRPFQNELAESKAAQKGDVALLQRENEMAAANASPASSQHKRTLQQQKDAMMLKDGALNVHATKAPHKMEKLQENENEMLFYEFEILNQESMTSIKPRTTTAELGENIRKNRYYDVLPYDFNRVKLKAADERAGSRSNDYINASHINMDDGTLKYIAAQGPIGIDEAAGGHRTNTTSDFWQMIWQERIDTIVMLTDCVEGGRQKCALYWPENAGGESITVCNDLSVNLYCITEDEICFQREMFLHKPGEPKRRIMQWHYKKWREAGGVAETENLLAFMEAIRATKKRFPILVHCSAGIGRTGVFIAIDILLEKLMRENVIDVFDTVARLRESRTNMVQTGEQYLTIYEAIALAIRRRTATRATG